MKTWRWGAALFLLSFYAQAGEAPQCRVMKLASLPIDFVGLQPTLHGKLNGVDVQLVMDSGATTTTLFSSAVRKADLEQRHADVISVGIGGQAQNFVAFARDVEIGPSRGTNVRFMGTSETRMSGDGLLGADYLFRTDLEVVLRDKQVTFLQADKCGDGPISYWDPDAPWIEAHDSSGVDPRQQVEVRINGHVFRALLDSGAMRSVLDVNAAAKIGLTPESDGTEKAGESSGIGARKVAVWRTRVDMFEIGPEAIRNAKIQLADIYGAARVDHGVEMKISGEDMILGADFMRAHHLLFARSQHRLYFTYLGGKIFSLEEPAQAPQPVAPAQ